MIPDRIKQRLVKDRRMTSITLRIPVDLVDSLKELAPKTGHSNRSPQEATRIPGHSLPNRPKFFTVAHDAALFVDNLDEQGVASIVALRRLEKPCNRKSAAAMQHFVRDVFPEYATLLPGYACCAVTKPSSRSRPRSV